PGTIYSHDTEFADVNNDGRMDAIANSDESGLFWYEIPDDPTRRWTSHTIATADEHEVHGGVSPQAVGDLDGDGDNDVATGAVWYENLNGTGTKWKRHGVLTFGGYHKYGLALRTWVGDLDGDGDADIVQSGADNPFGRVAWFENDGKGKFTLHVVKSYEDRQDFHSLAVADFDNDGDYDIFSGGGPLTANKDFKCYIWENTSGLGESPRGDKWEEHVLARKHCHEAVAADVDQDGDVDIVFKPWSGEKEHFFLENRVVE
ncbi:MAG: VCBS repeat-containing protein, partial [Verrucomicrobiae bacterium]|nr:VCBS repeat-containing protein [Verrucomicrobiae bacterium]